MLVEICPDVMKNLTKLLPDFRSLFRYTDLCMAKKNLYKRIEHMTALYVLRSKLISPEHYKISDEVIDKIIEEKVKQKKDARPEEEKKKEMDEKLDGISKTLKKVDRMLVKQWDASLTVMLNNIQISVTGNKEEKVTSNQCILDFGIVNQKITVRKQKNQFNINAFGVTINSYQPLLHIFKFALSTKESAEVHLHNLIAQTSYSQYKKFLTAIDGNQIEFEDLEKEIKPEVKPLMS